MMDQALIERARAVNVVDLAKAAGVQLREASAKEWAGPCPKCGGDDRFHVQADWWFCRQCHAKRGDAIEFERWLHGLTFTEAVNKLAGVAGVVAMVRRPAPAAAPKPKAAPARLLGGDAAHLVSAAHDRLFDAPAGAAGREYLEGRGIEPHTWQAFGLGYVAQAPTAEKAAAIVLPWYQRGHLVGARFRYLKPVGDLKVKSMAGSQFAGVLFGGQAMPDFVSMGAERGAEALRTLVLCEGEINAVSIWQVAHETDLDVLSVGSESQKIPTGTVAVAQRYGCVLTWFDKRERAVEAARLLPGAHAMNSKGLGGDANDLLQRGHLGGVLSAARALACRTSADRTRLRYALERATMLPAGVDAGTAQICAELATTC